MTECTQHIANFINCMIAAINTSIDTIDDNRFQSSVLISKLKTKGRQNNNIQKVSLPILNLLPRAMDTAISGSPCIKALALSLTPIFPKLKWYKREGDYPKKFIQGHANALIIGKEGLYKLNDLVVGITLLAPKIQYPDHDHPPEEVYITLSDGNWRQNAGVWSSPGLGGLVYNPKNITHSMRAKNEPLLAVWCLW